MLLDFVVPVAPNQYAFVPNPEETKKRILYTTSLASCFGLIILGPGKFLMMSHVVSANGMNPKYYQPMLKEVAAMNGGLNNLHIMFHGGQMTLKYATTSKAVVLVKKLFPKASFGMTSNHGDTLLVNSHSGYILNASPHGGPETLLLTKQLKELVGKVSRRTYFLPVCTNVHKSLDKTPVYIANTLVDRTASSGSSSSKNFDALNLF